MVQSDNLVKRFEDLAKILKKNKMELVFWGHPWGTTENLMVVMKGDVKDYEKLMNQSEVSAATNFYTNNRTHMVIAP